MCLFNNMNKPLLCRPLVQHLADYAATKLLTLQFAIYDDIILYE